MADDLEAFLRQAAQRRAGRKKPPPPSRPAPSKPQPASPARRPTPVVAEVVEAMVVPASTSRLETNVDTSDFERRAEHLGEEVGLADEHLEARLHDKFDHRLGALEDEGLGSLDSLDAPARAPRTAAMEIAQLLAHPDSLRNAIVLSEILAPPRDLW